ncbi:hypothetical protein BC833DRAFT_598844 [Globomyces pollinis-pini]|nr:hypothetical protein BC833DRAFT_598844 [Globomyces pollinis-pini]
MDSVWDVLQKTFTKAQQTIVLTAIVSSLITVGGLSTYQSFRRQKTIRKIKSDLTVDWDKQEEIKSFNGDLEVIVNEQLSRNIAFLGIDGVKALRSSFVVVVGLGGVGSHAAHMLVRAGVENIRFIDFDQVTLSSLNRHAVANREDVGIPKVIAMKNHLLKIVPHAKIEARVQMFDLEHAPDLLSGNPTFVLDCIDHLKTKAELIAYCSKNNIRVISSMGAGAKADPSRIQIADISETFEDPLARSTRAALRKMGCSAPVPVVYSTEKAGIVKLVPLDEEKVEEADQYSTLPTFRSRILPVLGTIPALFGNAMASYVLTELAGFETEPLAIKRNKRKIQDLYKSVVKAERSILGEDCQLKVNAEDAHFIFEEVWKSRSAISNAVNDKLVLTRWDNSKPADFGNLVCMSLGEAKTHSKVSMDQLTEHYNASVLEYVESRFKFEKALLNVR